MPKTVDQLMRDNNCPVAVFFRWESADSADQVFSTLRERKVWVPADGLVARLRGGNQIAVYQPHWIVVCGPYVMNGLKPFQHWWQYMKTVGLPEHDGWKGNWELDSDEKCSYDATLSVVDHFFT